MPAEEESDEADASAETSWGASDDGEARDADDDEDDE